MVTAATAHSAATRRTRARTEAQAVPAETQGYAGLITRIIAFAVDAALINCVAVLVAAVAALVASILPNSGVDHDVALVVGGAAFALWVVGYFVFFWATTGQTPGDRLLQIEVKRLDGQRVRPRQAIVRLLGIVLSLPLLLGFLPILVTDRRRGLHDWLAGTVVYSLPARERTRP